MFRSTIERKHRIGGAVKFFYVLRGRYKDHAGIGGEDLEGGAI